MQLPSAVAIVTGQLSYAVEATTGQLDPISISQGVRSLES
jgi:hypothetical protein